MPPPWCCPGAHPDDNAAIVSGKLIETTNNGNGIVVDSDSIQKNAGQSRLFGNIDGYSSPAAKNPDALVNEANP